MKEEDKKEGLLKRLKNIEKNQNSNDNDKNKKNIDYQLLSKQILMSSKNMFSFLDKYGDLYTFCINLFYNKINLDDFKLQQVEFLKDLKNGFEVYKKNQETK